MISTSGNSGMQANVARNATRLSPRLACMGNQSWTSLRVAGVPVAGVAVAALSVAVTTLIVYAAGGGRTRRCRSASCTCSRCCWWRPCGVCGSASRRRSPARSRSTSSTSRRPAGSRSPTGEHWVALAVFFVTAIVASELARARAPAGAAGRRAPARGGPVGRDGAPAAARRRSATRRSAAVAHRIATHARSAVRVDRGAEPSTADDRRVAFPLREGARQLGTLLVPADLPEATLAAPAGTCRAVARGAARGGARARRAALESRRGRRAAPHRRAEDGAPASRLA